MSISIIIPVHDVEKDAKNIERILKGLEQEFLDFELIFIISNLEYEFHNRKLTSILLNVPKILQKTTVHVSRENPGLARNIGLKYAKNDWVIFWDSDDEPVWKNISNVINTLDLPNCNLVIGQYELITTSNILRSSKNYNLKSVGNDPGIWRMVFKKSLLKNIIFPSASMGEDQYFFAMVLTMNPIIYFSDSKFYKHNFNFPGRLSTNVSKFTDLYLLLKNDYNQIFSSRHNLSIIRIIYTNQLITGMFRSSTKMRFAFLFIGSFFKRRLSFYALYSKSKKLLTWI